MNNRIKRGKNKLLRMIPIWAMVMLLCVTCIGCGEVDDTSATQISTSSEDQKASLEKSDSKELAKTEEIKKAKEKDEPKEIEEAEVEDASIADKTEQVKKPAVVAKEEVKVSEEPQEVVSEPASQQNALGFSISGGILSYKGTDYTIKEVDGGNRSGSRSNYVAVDIGFGDRVYWGLTNGCGQLVYVLAENVVLQNDDTEPVNADGRYYDDEANVPGTEHKDLDQGHIIADSLGGVANAYNITPQESTLNRHGDQAYMERGIRDAGGCSNFTAEIFYVSTSTQIPSSYKYTYTLMGNEIVDEFPNVNPDDYNTNIVQEEPAPAPELVPVPVPVPTPEPEPVAVEDISGIDTNGNGTVTIKEAKAAGFQMPIRSDHWLYKYMKDGDGDGMVGE